MSIPVKKVLLIIRVREVWKQHSMHEVFRGSDLGSSRSPGCF